MEAFVFKLLIQEGSMNILSTLKAITKIPLIMCHVATSELPKSSMYFSQSNHKRKYKITLKLILVNILGIKKEKKKSPIWIKQWSLEEK